MAKNAKMAADKKELEDLVCALGENRLPLRRSCMEGTRTTILQEIEDKIKNVNAPNVIWIRGSSGIGKSSLAASIASQLEDQKRHVISFHSIAYNLQRSLRMCSGMLSPVILPACTSLFGRT